MVFFFFHPLFHLPDFLFFIFFFAASLLRSLSRSAFTMLPCFVIPCGRGEETGIGDDADDLDDAYGQAMELPLSCSPKLCLPGPPAASHDANREMQLLSIMSASPSLHSNCRPFITAVTYRFSCISFIRFSSVVNKIQYV